VVFATSSPVRGPTDFGATLSPLPASPRGLLAWNHPVRAQCCYLQVRPWKGVARAAAGRWSACDLGGTGRAVLEASLFSPAARRKAGHLSGKSLLGRLPQKANAGDLTQEQLVDQTVQIGFNNVIDAFHVVGRDEVPQRFFVDERRSRRGIRMTQFFADLIGGDQNPNLPLEAEARWRLVETAWELGVSPALLAVSHDPATESLFVVDADRRRKSITGARDALSGYQKGHCFYCFDNFSLTGAAQPDVDHFFPHCLKAAGLGGSIDGVWNLVLACRRCNRGVAGESSLIPSIRLLARLSTRNEFLIASSHPLRDTLMAQTGAGEVERREFLNAFYMEARAALVHYWEPVEVAEALF